MNANDDEISPQARALAEKHGIPHAHASRLLAEHDEDSPGFSEALRNLIHFLRSPS